MTVALIAQSFALVGAMIVVARWSIAPLAARIDGLESKMDARFVGSDARIDGLESKMDARFVGSDARIDGLEAKLDARFDTVDHRLSALEGDVMLIKQHLLSQRAG